MSKPEQIFQTDNPSRWRRVQWSFRVLLAVAVFLFLVLFLALARFKNPSLPLLEQQADYYQKILKPKGAITFKNSRNKAYQGFRDILQQTTDSSRRNRAAARENPFIRSAFYSPWDPNAQISLRTYGSKINLVFPEWFFIKDSSFSLDNRLDSAGLNLMQKNNLRILPVISNYSTALQDFDPRLVHQLLHSKALSDRFILSVKDTLLKYNFQGVNVDFEELNESGSEYLVSFMKDLYQVLHPLGKLVTIDVSPENDDYDYDKLADWSDYIVLMAYDQHYEESVPGPVSAQKWVEAAMDIAAKDIPSGKIILGLAGYGYDWPKSGKGETITYTKALNIAQEYHANIDFDDDTYNLHFTYTTKDVNENTDVVANVAHDVWFTDAATLFNTVRFAEEYGAAGTALWRLGVEDTRMWTFYPYDLSNNGLAKHPFDFNSLTYVPLQWDNASTPIGEGEILSVESMPQDGKIVLDVDTTEKIITEQHYLQLPVSFMIRRFGEDTSEVHPKIVLTFDDGPDPRWTPQIMDILQKDTVPAAFFVVGINAEKNIPILRKEFQDGYEIGNHTFTHGNIALMSPQRAELEMKLTRLLIECVTGRSTILFRPPYNADSEPHTFEELMPIARSKKDNYYTVGEAIDPEDWEPGVSADSIFARVVRIEKAGRGNIILLHDAGGDSREATVKALPMIIDYFKKRGYQFTTVSHLMGKTYDDVMPLLPKTKDTWMVHANYWLASATYWGGEVVFVLFLVGIGLSMGRMLIMLVMAFYQRKKDKLLEPRYQEVAASWKTAAPLVSIVIPAYNEEVNAVPTIESLLQQDYPNFNVVFVDDGSKDQTFERVKTAFAGNPKVHVVTKPNGGKASALNYGIHITDAEYMVCIDADTQLRPNAVSELMTRFTDDRVGAVAGNVKVGNEKNILTYWQSIEYITAQNFDRRAFDLLNCITVVPGAIGAFRRTAISDAGIFTTDTLAEDCDLTMRLLRSNYVVRNCATALAYTEAPETVGMFLKQRFRWSFGVMQCFWKHRDACFNSEYKAFGWIALPNILIFQIVLPFLAPLADLILVLSLIAASFSFVDASTWHIVFYYIVFTLVDVAGAALAFGFEKEDPRKLFWMIPQRLVYRQLMYYILIRSFRRAIKGELQGWGKLKRTGNVKAASN